jgi:hypothetical protein
MVHDWLIKLVEAAKDKEWQAAAGVLFRPGSEPADDRRTVSHWPASGAFRGQTSPKVEVHSVRSTRRAGPDGQDQRQLIIEITQRRRGFYDSEAQEKEEGSTAEPLQPDFVFRGGATLIFDLYEITEDQRHGSLRYVIRKRICDDPRLGRQAEFLKRHRFGGFGVAYSASDQDDVGEDREPFALVHRGV